MTANPAVEWRLLPAGEAAVMAHVASGSAEERWGAAFALRQHLLDAPFPGFVDLVSSYEDVLIQFDPGRIDPETVRFVLRQALPSLPGAGLSSETREARRSFTVPALFDEECGPDLREVAETLSWGVDRLIDAICSDEYTIRLLGAGMEPMCSASFPARPVPRRDSPRPRVPAGTLALAADSFAIYPFDAPGGWQLVGRTPLLLSDLERAEPVSYRPGDVLRVRRIEAGEWDRWRDRLLEPDDV